MLNVKNALRRIVPSSSITLHRLSDEQLKCQYMNRVLSDSQSLYMSCMANEIVQKHREAFSQYKDYYLGKEVVIVGAGPSLSYYHEKISNAIHIGVNGTYRIIDLDYLFFQDFENEGHGGVFDVDEIKKLKCKKFVGRYVEKRPDIMQAPEYIDRYVGAQSYYVSDYHKNSDFDNTYIDYGIPLDICHFPLVDNASSVFAAIHFALWTHPSRIYIVGCDCSYSMGQHFDDSTGKKFSVNLVKRNWNIMKKHIDTYYPDIEVISINPIGLIGLFNDRYTDGFVKAQILPPKMNE